MIQKVSYPTNAEKERFTERTSKWIASMGSHNNLPTPFKPCHEDDFIHAMTGNTLDFIEYRQVCHEDTLEKMKIHPTVATSVHIYWFATTAYAVAWPNDWTIKKTAEDVYRINTDDHLGGTFYLQRPKYYRLGCDHNWQGLGITRCRELNLPTPSKTDHSYECEHCKTTMTLDSSD